LISHAVKDKEVVMAARRSKFEGIIISHLGNIDGRQEENENTLPYIQKALKEGWHVCIDVLFRNGSFMLPHDKGYHVIPPALLSKQRVWCRAYDGDTIDALCNVNAHCFLMSPDLSLTSAQFIWTMPPHALAARAIAAFPELTIPEWLDLYEPAGLCSNEPLNYV
jgi:hypothetical protein